MVNAQVRLLAFVVVVVSLFVGGAIAKRGSPLLDATQFGQLKAMGPDPLAMAAPLVMLAATWLSPRYPWPMVLIVVLATGVALYRVAYRQWSAAWPRPARTRLVAGNGILSAGCGIAALLYVSQYLGGTAL